jgi:hypothetical protein
MTHSTEEQFEQVLAGELAPPEHLDACDACRTRLADHKAVQTRLRSAMGGVSAPDALRRRIAETVAARATTQEGEPSRAAAPRQAHRRQIRFPLWPVAMAAAVAVMVIVPVIALLSRPEPALAGQEQLYAIHAANLGEHGSEHGEFMADGDSEQLAAYFTDKLGFVPAMPILGAGMELRGCCVRHFRGGVAGSYVVQTPRSVISIIVVNDPPQALGMDRTIVRNGREYGIGSFAQCGMVTARLGKYTYCAVGESSTDFLADLLDRLVNNPA